MLAFMSGMPEAIAIAPLSALAASCLYSCESIDASGDDSAVATYKLSELLPAAFGPKDLGLID